MGEVDGTSSPIRLLIGQANRVFTKLRGRNLLVLFDGFFRLFISVF